MSQSCLSALPWQALRPQLDIQQLEAGNAYFWDLQPQAHKAVRQFLQNPASPLLVLKAEDQNASAQALQQLIASQQPADLPLAGVHYEISQADSFSFAQVNVLPAQSHQDNFAAQKQVATALFFDSNQLFGSLQIHPISKDLQLNSGLVHQLNNGVLILSVSPLLNNFELWQRLKHILQSQRFDWYSQHPFKSLPCPIPSYDLNLKVILLGSRSELATLSELDEQLYPLADYAEINSYWGLEQREQQQRWAQYVRTFAAENYQLELDLAALNLIYQELVRESEERNQISIAPYRLQGILTGAAAFAQKSKLSAQDFSQFFAQRASQASFLREQTYADILREQIYIATEGEAVGQINGLSVIEYPGVPLAFGEPSRISCLVKFGDGEVVDIERKNELAGNLHSKGMMIAEACLANLFELPSQLPFSASLVFEQSYGEIDGDSASLAAFCVLISALADLPLPQSIALTGTIDQFGLTHAVGGVNDKIEGFFAICQARGLSGKQGVMIPTSVCQQLCLSEEVVQAVANQQFHIWAVEDVHQACQILFGLELIEGENSTKESISQLIQQRIEQRSEPAQKLSFWRSWFAKG